MNSCLYEGRILHARKKPVLHQFWFRTFFFYLDLDELDVVFGRSLLFSSRGRAIARFRYSDHLFHNAEINNQESLREAVINVLRSNGIQDRIGPIRLLTQLRYLGFVMNPVSFYYCFDESGNQILAIIAEVNNTPWGEQHLYVIKGEGRQDRRAESRQIISANKVDKEFHVSPFMPLNMTYDFDFTYNEDRLSVKIANYEDAQMMLSVGMSLKRQPITPNQLRLSLLRYPLISWKVFAGIYWQALRLYLKRVPFFPHPRNRDAGLEVDCENPAAKVVSPSPTAGERDSVKKQDSILISQ